MVNQLHRACQNCNAFNAKTRPGEPTCWNLVCVDGREPTASDWCDQHLDAMEAALLDEVLDGLPFDDCGENAEAEIVDHCKAVSDFNRRMVQARRTTAQTLARARYD